MFTVRFRWLEALPLLVVTGALAVIAISALSGEQLGRERFFDYFQRVHPASSSNVAPFHVISIDRESIDRVGPWPWPRTILADLAGRAREAGAAGVVVVEPVDSPDPLSPQTIGDFWLAGARDEGLARQLALLPGTDESLAAVLGTVPGAIAIAEAVDPGLASGAPQRTDIGALGWLAIEGRGGDFLALPAARPRFAVNPVLAAAAQSAVAALPADADGVVRRVTPLWSVGGAATPSLSFEAVRLALGETTFAVAPAPTSVSAAGAPPAELIIGERRLPLTQDGTLRLYMPRRLMAPETPAWRILEAGAANSQLAGQVVFIGLDRDQGRAVETARGRVSAAQAHALAARQMWAGVSLSRPGWAGYLEAIAVMLLGAAAIMWSQKLDFWRAVGVAAICSLALIIISGGAFIIGDLLLNPLPAALALFLGAFSVAGGRSLGVVLRDDTVRGSFHGSLPEPTMKKLREEGATEILDGDHRPISVLACELRLTDEDMEKLALTPDDVTKLITSACLDLRKAIIDAGGAAEQAEGGKIFAYFNAPLENADHVNAACSSALRLIESMDKINAELDASPRLRSVQLHLAIGAATGDCFVGPMGHGRNNRYSAIGPAVDMATFLRRQAEYYGPAIICDESIYRKTHHHFAYLELDRLKSSKSDTPFSIYALVGNPFIKSSKSYRALDEAHRKLLNAYREGDWETAGAHLAKVKESPGSKIALFDIYGERIAKMRENGAPKDWDGARPVTI